MTLDFGTPQGAGNTSGMCTVYAVLDTLHGAGIYSDMHRVELVESLVLPFQKSIMK